MPPCSPGSQSVLYDHNYLSLQDRSSCEDIGLCHLHNEGREGQANHYLLNLR